MDRESAKKLVEEVAGEALEGFLETGDVLADAFVSRDKIVDVLLTLREEKGFKMLVDLFGVDRRPDEERLEVVYLLLNLKEKARIRIRVKVPFDDPVVPSLTPRWKGADWFEREAYDMFGIVFKGHPDLRRLLMWEGFDGHPLRKDFPLKGKLLPDQRYSRNDPRRHGWEA